MLTILYKVNANNVHYFYLILIKLQNKNKKLFWLVTKVQHQKDMYILNKTFYDF